jgi:mersacidin/lichenicidin family type 2 lantibiotic
MSPKKPPYSHPLAQIYFARALDPVIEIARAVSDDFVKRPQLYTRVPDDVAILLANFRSLIGKHPEWPNASQRSYTSSKFVSRFCQGFAGIRLSAILYIQRVSDSGRPLAQHSFIESAALLRASVQPLEGTVSFAVERTNSGILKRAMSVLSSSSVSTAFGVAEVPSGDWPSGGIFSPQLAYLCESVSQSLALKKPIVQPTLSILQRAAHHGADTISGVLDPSFTDAASGRVPDVMQSASAWATALHELLLRIDMSRAWREPEYRGCLHCLEKDIMPPHPSGEINLEGTVKTESPRLSSAGLGLSTETVEHEVCCCTGDLGCAPNTNGDCGLSDDCPTLTTILI